VTVRLAALVGFKVVMLCGWLLTKAGGWAFDQGERLESWAREGLKRLGL
jgi:hypothetical protein